MEIIELIKDRLIKNGNDLNLKDLKFISENVSIIKTIYLLGLLDGFQTKSGQKSGQKQN